MNFRHIRLFSVFFLLSACGISQPSVFYTLDSGPLLYENTTLKNVDTVIIGIEPIVFPSYLDRPQIVVRDTETSVISFSEFHRWAEYLRDAFPRVIGDAISQRVGYPLAKQVSVNRDLFEYRLYIEVLRVDAELGNMAVLDAWWVITDPSANVLYRTRSTLTEPVDSTYESVVKAEQTLAKRLGYAVADYYSANLAKSVKTKVKTK